jgi:hypothetical protein
MKLLQAAFQEFKKEHPKTNLPTISPPMPVPVP